MPTLSLKPNGVNTFGSWGSSLSVATTDLITAVTDGNDGTWDSDVNLAEDLLFEYENMTPAGANISVLNLVSRWADFESTAQASSYARARINGVLYSGAIVTAGATGGYFNATDTFTTQLVPALGQTISDSQFGAAENNYSVSPMGLVEQRLDVTYSNPKTAFVASIISVIVSLGVLRLEDMGKIADEVFRRTGVRWLEHELIEAWRDWREYTAPRYARI